MGRRPSAKPEAPGESPGLIATTSPMKIAVITATTQNSDRLLRRQLVFHDQIDDPAGEPGDRAPGGG